MPKGPPLAYHLELWILTAIAVALFYMLHGCGASTQTRVAYATEQARCIANERAIVDRAGSTAAEDRADLEAERARCDEALRAIEGGQ
jgi:hypothetical protein